MTTQPIRHSATLDDRGRLWWTDSQGDRFQIEDETTVADVDVFAGLIVSDPRDNEEAAVWLTRGDASALINWLVSRLAERPA